jgi:hypothetical protein
MSCPVLNMSCYLAPVIILWAWLPSAAAGTMWLHTECACTLAPATHHMCQTLHYPSPQTPCGVEACAAPAAAALQDEFAAEMALLAAALL